MARAAAMCLLALVATVALALPPLTLAALTPNEQILLSGPTADGARQHLQYYTSIAHMAGTAEDLETAQYTASQLQQLGIQAAIQPFKVWLNYPGNRSLEMTAPVSYTAALAEDIVPQDGTSDTPWRSRTFHGYAAAGDVTGELVYANYGSYEDFELLQRMGVDFKGKIVIVRYGHVFRGIKVQNAQDFGAVGCLIYSDPADDGFGRGKTYPDGPWRPSSGVQRGSVQFLSRCSGDPMFIERDPAVCGYPTDELIPAIPSLPLSYGDALPLLQQIGGFPAPNPSWIGGLNTSYSVGPGPARVHLHVEMDYDVRTLWNVVGTIPGAHPDPSIASQQVLLGNHRDAWVFGATDPNSGTATMLELARGFSKLLATGWRPDRTIKILSWDGEEYGLLGSVNYVETNEKDLLQNAVAYLNVDVAVTGPWFGVQATPSLAQLVLDCAADVVDPNSGKALLDVWNPSHNLSTVGVLGSGSDYAPFLHHEGIASLDMGFDGDYGVYHSDYDSFTWMSLYGDPQFAYHRAMAQMWSLMAMRLATARVLPVRMSDYAQQLASYLPQVQQMAEEQQMSGLDWSALSQAVDGIQAPCALVECYRQFVASTPSLSQSEVSALSVSLARIEQSWILTPADNWPQNGLPGRPYYKHIIQAPGLDTGYAANVFPSLCDAIDRNNATEAQIQIGLLASKLNTAADAIAKAAPYVAPGCTAKLDNALHTPKISLY